MAPKPAPLFDAAAILKIGTPSTEPLPEPEDGYVVLRVPAGLSLQTLRDSPAGQQLMEQHHWCDQYPWSKQALPPGDYRLRLPIPGSNHKTFAEQQAMLPEGEQIAPAALVIAALMGIQVQGGADPLGGDWTRCAELTAAGRRLILAWNVSFLYVGDDWDVSRFDYLLVSSVRTPEPCPSSPCAS